VSALIAYKKNVVNDPYSSEVVKVTGSDQKSVGLYTQALSILYDVSGAKTPNSYGTGKDIRGLNIAIKTGADIVNLGKTYSAVDCSTTASTSTDATIKSNYDAYCGAKPSRWGSDYWAGAKKACVDQGMKLPTKDELLALYNDPDWAEKPTTGWFWSSSEADTSIAYVVRFDYGDMYISTKDFFQTSVVCIGN
ncbi:hypothetical protein IJZ97_01570, partial [bacterium]|nr:hypothetical protein [bacterium]